MPALALVAGCALPEAPAPAGIEDPFEERNRRVHAANKGIDRAVLRPVARAYGAVVPGVAQTGLRNVANTLDLPGTVVNNLLQLDLPSAARNSARFTINATLGIGGLFDPAGEMGLAEADTDFGETLHVWGVPEGAYVELPVFGPSNKRDALGTVVDIVLNPLGPMLSDETRRVVTAIEVGEVVDTRNRYAVMIDGVLYESADSYAQSRLLYLQNRRFTLHTDIATPDEDPMALDTEGF
ncbi:MlaA family lipoprotein [Poseidonocella sedimentorum]|uniref:MlaA family lipoprotein n=1 Tax=Poseidonocella sedimentorum TaxID=871652 RepID=UPI001FE74D08|nr:VacJ family lipoprotein [Poseidonocella sedimentorum]